MGLPGTLAIPVERSTSGSKGHVFCHQSTSPSVRKWTGNSQYLLREHRYACCWDLSSFSASLVLPRAERECQEIRQAKAFLSVFLPISSVFPFALWIWVRVCVCFIASMCIVVAFLFCFFMAPISYPGFLLPYLPWAEATRRASCVLLIRPAGEG